LVAIEEQAKSQEKGRWSKATPETDHIRDVKWNVENPTNFVDSFRGKPVNGQCRCQRSRLDFFHFKIFFY
jgi:staphylococcal nuclease domain-containing protein 1